MHVSGQRQIVFTAPRAELFGKRVDKQHGQNFVIIAADRGKFFIVAAVKKFRQMVENIIAEFFKEKFRKTSDAMKMLSTYGIKMPVPGVK